MDFEVRHGGNVQDRKSQRSSCSIASSMLLRSKSYPHNRDKEHDWDLSREDFRYRNFDIPSTRTKRKVRRKQRLHDEVRSSLQQEILHLEKRLSGQFAVRCALEKALGFRSASIDTVDNNLMPKDTKELMREISVLEMEVMYLEQYLLSLYRKAFDQQFATPPPPSEDQLNTSPSFQRKFSYEVCGLNFPFRQGEVRDSSNEVMLHWNQTFDPSNENGVDFADKLGPGVHRSQSALSQQSICNIMSPQAEKIDKALRSCHSQPLSFLEHAKYDTPQAISLAEYLGRSVADHVPETPHELSEDLVRCISSIYCKIMEPPMVYPGVSSSPISSCSSMSPLSPQYVSDTWSPGCRKNSSFSAPLENPYRLEGLKEFSGPYSEMLEVPSICTDSERLKSVEDLLKDFRVLIHRLEKVDFGKMENYEKLAFWINIHNALVMHEYVEHGIPQNYLKKSSILFKAACNIGGRMINAEAIQNTILGCRTNRPGQWLRTFLSPKSKLRAGDELQAYAIEHSEPLLYFALCTGSHSDPAVRVYTPKKVFQQLETAKEEYIRAAVSIRKEQKIMLPKILESFARESNMGSRYLVDLIQQYLPETLQIVVKRCQAMKLQKCIEWIPQNFSFRYLLSRELACPVMSL